MLLAACGAKKDDSATNTTSPQDNAGSVTQSDAPDAIASDAYFKGNGSEPGWTLEIHQQDEQTFPAVFNYDYGNKQIRTHLKQSASGVFEAIAMEGGAAAPALRIRITQEKCRHAGSGEYSDSSVSVTLNQDEYRGCGELFNKGPGSAIHGFLFTSPIQSSPWNSTNSSPG
ncbi:hypothetical protein PQR62_14905 [Herbaspirillum lusitanum]|uniref:Lipoprotein n=1 Tax=Herbaspirillum lusitanum TaxID=213312 RepID=A0ABW9AB68_9BURK